MCDWSRTALLALQICCLTAAASGYIQPHICGDPQHLRAPCPEETPGEGYRWVDGDPTAAFPACCRQKLHGCWREEVNQWAADGDEWTGEGCTQVSCRNGTIRGKACGLIGLPPDSDCRIEEGNPGAPYPACCSTVNCSVCWAPELGRSVRVGEKWTLEGCSGQATCRKYGAVSAVGCALEHAAPGVPCALDEGQPDSDDYPSCCPKVTCPDCYSQALQRFFGPEDTWHEPGCLKKRCHVTQYNSVIIQQEDCESLSRDQPPPPDPSCTLLDEGIGEFPACCPTYQCRYHCFSRSKNRFYAVGEEWTEEGSCTLSRCVEGSNVTAFVAALPCGFLGPPPQPHCQLVPRGASGQYPDCCLTYSCPEPTCYSAFQDKRFAVGERWTEEGCTVTTCVLERSGEARAAPLLPCGLLDIRPGCVVTEGNSSLEYPDCCPKAKCGVCYSQELEQFFKPGESWTVPPCGLATCHEGGAISGKGCGGIAAPPWYELKKVEPGTEYPACCPRYIPRPRPEPPAPVPYK